MDNPNPIYYRDLITPDDSITKLIEQLDELITKYDGAKSKIQGAAAEMAKGIQGVSGASEDQRKAIQLVTEQSEKLVAEYRDVTSAQWKATQAFAEATAAKKESAQIDKLITQINTSAEGSYNRLSAQYRLNKIRLNEMSAAERQGTEAGRALEQESAALYEEMKRLQEATGKHQLNVGNYADAAKGLRAELISLTQQMAYMKTQGEQNSEEYRNMALRAGQLKDAMMDAQRETKAMASDTQQLDAVMGAASVASGGMAVYTGLMSVTGEKSEEAAETQRKLGASIAVLSGLTVIQNQLQKESNLMTGIRILQTRAATKAEQLDTATKKKNIVVTTAATVAQRIFNAVAKANPYVLLAMALISVVGALVAFSTGANKAAKAQENLNKATAAQLDYMEQSAKARTRQNNENIQALQNELEIAKARNASTKEIQALEDSIYEEKVKAHKKLSELYYDEIHNLDENRASLEYLQRTLLMLQNAQAAGKNHLIVDVDMDGTLENVKIDKAINDIQGQIDNYGRKVQIGVDLATEEATLETERAVQLAQRRAAARNAAQQRNKAELDATRSAEDARLALIADSYTREYEMLRVASERRIEDIRTRLKTERNLSKKAREALNEELMYLEEKYQRDVEDLRNKYVAKDLATVRESEDMRIALMADGAEKQREELRVSYERQIEDLTTTLNTDRDLTVGQMEEMYKQLLLLGEQYRKDLAKLNNEIAIDQMNAEADRIQLRLAAVKEGSEEEIALTVELLKKQRDIELAENAQKAEDVRQSEADIIAKWDAEIMRQTTELTKKRALALLDAEQELAASEFALMARNEREKTQFQLAQEKARLEKILELDAAASVKMTEQERQAIVNTIAAIQQEAARMPYDNIYELLGIGLDSKQQSALNEAFSSMKDSIGSLIDSWNAAAEAATNAANAQVDAAQKALDAEIEARAAGYANEVETAQKELDLAKKNQEKAKKQQEQANKLQLALDSVQQASSLTTATANIWKAFTGLGAAGIVAASLATATMWGAFTAAKIKAFQVTQQSEQYGDGTVELLQGGSHASGHDIDLGVTRTGKRRRAEGGEFFAIINKRNSRRYRDVIPDVINSLNNGTFADRYQRANAAMAGYAVQMIGGGKTDVSGLEKDVAAIRQQGDRSQYVDGQGNTIIHYKNLTRKITN